MFSVIRPDVSMVVGAVALATQSLQIALELATPFRRVPEACTQDWRIQVRGTELQRSAACLMQFAGSKPTSCDHFAARMP